MTDTGTGPGTEGGPAGLDPGTWRLAVVAGVRMDMPGEHPEVLVHEAVAPWRELAIPVGMAEGNAIAYGWRGLTTARPLTHALFTDVLERHGVELEAVRITARQGRSFFAELDTVGPRGRQVISCRPSDALALVLRQRMPTPVLVADWVFDQPDTADTGSDDDAGVTAGTTTGISTGINTGPSPAVDASPVEPPSPVPPPMSETAPTIADGGSPTEGSIGSSTTADATTVD